jgi:hypothetical protein
MPDVLLYCCCFCLLLLPAAFACCCCCCLLLVGCCQFDAVLASYNKHSSQWSAVFNRLPEGVYHKLPASPKHTANPYAFFDRQSWPSLTVNTMQEWADHRKGYVTYMLLTGIAFLLYCLLRCLYCIFLLRVCCGNDCVPATCAHQHAMP